MQGDVGVPLWEALPVRARLENETTTAQFQSLLAPIPDPASDPDGTLPFDTDTSNAGNSGVIDSGDPTLDGLLGVQTALRQNPGRLVKRLHFFR